MTDLMKEFDTVGDIVQALREIGFDPVLIGGMALIVLGSQRVTHDFDFVIAHPGDRLAQLLDVFYDRGLELVSRVSDGAVRATIDNRKVAAARLKIDGPASAFFFKVATRLRVDLLFDFPVSAAELAQQATRTKVRSRVFHIASEEDLLRLKRIAQKGRSKPGEADDIAFLEARQRKTTD
jgi:hypothetical protein